MPISTNEQRLVDCIRVNYHRLFLFKKNFGAALSLLGWVALQRINDAANVDQHFAWGPIATDHAALSVFHFGKTLLAIRSLAARAPASHGAIDTQELRLAWKRYKREFPHVDNVRHAVAHAGELNSTPERTAIHTIARARSIGYFHSDGKIVGSANFRIGLNGRWFDLDIGESTAQTLEQITSQVGRSLPSSLKDAAPP